MPLNVVPIYVIEAVVECPRCGLRVLYGKEPEIFVSHDLPVCDKFEELNYRDFIEFVKQDRCRRVN